MENLNKAIPLPSIELLESAYLAGANRMYNISRNRKSFTFDGIAEFAVWNKQNGVETDNGQPNECKCGGDTSCVCD